MDNTSHMSQLQNEPYCGNAIEVLPGLWLGDIKSSMNSVFLNEKQIKCIINCTDCHPFIDDASIEAKYRLSIKNNNDIDEIEKFYHLLDEVVDLIKTNICSYNILVHCYAGKQISAAVVVAYLIKYGKMEAKSAINAIQSKKPDVLDDSYNYDVVLQVYEKSLLHKE